MPLIEPWGPWWLVDAILYALLALAALYRLVLKVLRDMCGAGGGSNSRHVVVALVYAALASYSIVRSIILALTGWDRVPDDESLGESLFDMIPTVFLCLLQTTLIAKWAGHVDDISLVLNDRSFRWKRIIVGSSIALAVLQIVLLLAVIADQSRSSPSLSSETWVSIVNAASGFAYVANGLMFAVLGLILRFTWQPVTVKDVQACRRILGIAILFGGVCVIRGAMLFVFVDSSHHTVVYNRWAAPFVMSCEWIALVTSLFGLTNVGGSAASAAGVMRNDCEEPLVIGSAGRRKSLVGQMRELLYRGSRDAVHSSSDVGRAGGGSAKDVDDHYVANSEEFVPSSTMTLNDAGE